VDFATHSGSAPTQWFAEYHHVLTHNLLFALLVASATLLLAKRRSLTVFLVLFVFHLHLLGDIVGARGPAPEGYQWPILYLWPISGGVVWTWQGQWELNAWPNFVITIAVLMMTIFLAWRRGYSLLELVSRNADTAFVMTLRNRFSGRHSRTAPVPIPNETGGDQ
jgi:hypothetical protein